MTGKVVVDDLHALLDNAKVEPPYVLVGHSFGGLLVRLSQSQYRDEVEGMVLIDASDEDQFRRLNQPSDSCLRGLKNLQLARSISRLF